MKLGPGSHSTKPLLQEKPHAAFIGVPALYHGGYDDPKADIELQLARVCAR